MQLCKIETSVIKDNSRIFQAHGLLKSIICNYSLDLQACEIRECSPTEVSEDVAEPGGSLDRAVEGIRKHRHGKISRTDALPLHIYYPSKHGMKVS